MADSKKNPAFDGLRGQPYEDFNSDERIDQSPDNASTIDAQNFAYTEDRKIGVTGAVFLILNKMIGTGSKLPMMSYCQIKLTISLLNSVKYLCSDRIGRYMSHAMGNWRIPHLLRSQCLP
jgi:hypothetical protein